MFRLVQRRASSMPTRVLGKTGVNLPILGFGTAHSGLRLNTRERSISMNEPSEKALPILIPRQSLQAMEKLKCS